MKLTRILIFVAFVFLSVTVSFSQSDNPLPIKKFGAGIHIEHYKLNDRDLSTNGPVNKIVLSVSPTNWLRIEPEIGFNFLKNNRDSLNTNEFYVGLGAFWMKQYKRINIYSGLRVEYASYIDEYEIYLFPSGNTIAKDKRYLYKFGPSIGCEYFLTDRFSIGGEIGAKYGYIVYTHDPLPEGFSDRRFNYIASDNGLLIRYYF